MAAGVISAAHRLHWDQGGAKLDGTGVNELFAPFAATPTEQVVGYK
jgi:hypothetical protein